MSEPTVTLKKRNRKVSMGERIGDLLRRGQAPELVRRYDAHAAMRSALQDCIERLEASQPHDLGATAIVIRKAKAALALWED